MKIIGNIVAKVKIAHHDSEASNYVWMEATFQSMHVNRVSGTPVLFLLSKLLKTSAAFGDLGFYYYICVQ